MRVVLNYLWLSGLVIVSSLGNLAWAQVITEEAEAVETQPETVETQPEAVGTLPDAVGTLPDAVMAAVVTIRGDKGSGTGFVAKFQGNLVIVTNQHVLANNAKLTIVDNQGKNLTGSKFAAASDADIAMIQLDPASPDQAFLTLAESVESASRKDTPVLIPGNSNGDGVITVTPGKVIGIGAKKVEVTNPIYPGNSGSPIIVEGSNEVIGVLTEAHILNLDQVGEKSLKNKDSQIKSDIRYFGHRIDNVARWVGMNWKDFRSTSEKLATFEFELDSLASYLFDPAKDRSFEKFEELAKSNERAIKILNQRASGKDKIAAIRDVTRYMRVLATRRITTIERLPMYYTHQQNFSNLKELSAHIVKAVQAMEEDYAALEKVVY